MKTIHDNEITNECICADEQGEYVPECFGCWDDEIEYFSEVIKDFFNGNATYYFRIGGIKLWDREVGGIAECKTPLELIQAMTVNSGWSMRYTVHPECIEYSLSHHDAPMGSASFVRHATDEEIENNRY